MPFRDPARACFSSRKRTAIIPTSYPRRHARLKVYPYLLHRPPAQTLLQNTPATTRQPQLASHNSPATTRQPQLASYNLQETRQSKTFRTSNDEDQQCPGLATP